MAQRGLFFSNRLDTIEFIGVRKIALPEHGHTARVVGFKVRDDQGVECVSTHSEGNVAEMFAKAKRLNVLKGRQIKRHSAAIVNLRRSDSQPKGSREKEIAIRDTLRQQLVDKRAVIARVESVLSKAVLALATGSELREPSHPLAVGRAAAAPSRQRYG